MSVPELRVGVLLIARSSMTVASGREGFPTDAIFYRLPGPNGKIPAIPGSTVKGMLRKSASKVAPILDLTSCGSVRPEGAFYCLERWGQPCSVHAIFGAPEGPPSCIEVSCFLPVRDAEQASAIFERADLWLRPIRAEPGFSSAVMNITRVCLLDAEGVAAPGMLYTYEQVASGTQFYGEVAIRPRPGVGETDVVKLLLGALANLRMDRLGRAGLIDVVIVGLTDRFRRLAAQDEACEALLKSLKEAWWK